jgi:hypothetical protein
VTKVSETQLQTEATDKESQLPESAAPSKQSGRKSVLALSVFALGLNATAAVYTLSPSDFSLPTISIPLPSVSSLAELLPHQRAPVSTTPDPVVAALKDIQSAQQQHAAALQGSGSLLQQNTALLQQDSTTLASLRQSITDEQVDVRKIYVQLSRLIAKVDSLQNAITPDITSSVSKGRAYNRLSLAARKRMVRQAKPFGPVSVGGAPLTTVPGPIQSPEG